MTLVIDHYLRNLIDEAKETVQHKYLGYCNCLKGRYRVMPKSLAYLSICLRISRFIFLKIHNIKLLGEFKLLNFFFIMAVTTVELKGSFFL